MATRKPRESRAEKDMRKSRKYATRKVVVHEKTWKEHRDKYVNGGDFTEFRHMLNEVTTVDKTTTEPAP